MKKAERLGEKIINLRGQTCEIIEYVNTHKIHVLIHETGEKRWARWYEFKRGRVYSRWPETGEAIETGEEQCQEGQCGIGLRIALLLVSVAIAGGLSFGAYKLLTLLM